MFGMGFGEMLVVLIIAVIFLGPDKIPETARTLGKWFHELKSSMDEIKQSFEADVREGSQNIVKPTPPNSNPAPETKTPDNNKVS